MPNKKLEALVGDLERRGALKSGLIKQAMLEVDRKDFVPERIKDSSYEDQALPLTDGQTISQPTTVAFMLELLEPKPGQKILDIGAGSGWVSALLAHIAGKNGKVFAYEIKREVGEMGIANIKKTGFQNIEYRIVDAAQEWHKNGPYDRVISGAAFEDIPGDLIKLLGPQGILVAPTQNGFIKKIFRYPDGDIVREDYYGFSFVPFVKE